MPMKALFDGIKACDAWVEFNYKLIFYSTVYDKITEDPNNRPRYMKQNGVHPELLVRNIGKVDNILLNKFIQGFSDYCEAGHHMRFTTPAGTDMMFYKVGRDPGFFNGVLKDGKGYSSSSIEVYVPIEETKTEGVMVLDGSLGYIGRAEEPTRILFKGGRITEIEETPTGIRLKKYMEDYQDPRIYIAGELGIGLNSCSQCLGNCYIEDESAYGTFHVGLGRNIALGGIQNAKGHFDLVCMEPDIYTDNRQIMQQGKVIIPEPVLY